jgi:hypothetical protein
MQKGGIAVVRHQMVVAIKIAIVAAMVYIIGKVKMA